MPKGKSLGVIEEDPMADCMGSSLAVVVALLYRLQRRGPSILPCGFLRGSNDRTRDCCHTISLFPMLRIGMHNWCLKD